MTPYSSKWIGTARRGRTMFSNEMPCSASMVSSRPSTPVPRTVQHGQVEIRITLADGPETVEGERVAGEVDP